MIDKLINVIFSWEKLRLAIFDEVHMYDHLDSILKDPEAMKIASKYWKEGNLWYGWSYNEAFNRYYFYDQGKASILDLMDTEGIL